jgi:hypothetical protein
MVEPVTQLFAAQQPPGPTEADVTPELIVMVRAVAAIAATRILLLIAVLTGSAIWTYTVMVDPSRDRLFAAIAFSIVFVIPQVILYWRKG